MLEMKCRNFWYFLLMNSWNLDLKLNFSVGLSREQWKPSYDGRSVMPSISLLSWIFTVHPKTKLTHLESELANTSLESLLTIRCIIYRLSSSTIYITVRLSQSLLITGWTETANCVLWILFILWFIPAGILGCSRYHVTDKNIGNNIRIVLNTIMENVIQSFRKQIILGRKQ